MKRTYDGSRSLNWTKTKKWGPIWRGKDYSLLLIMLLGLTFYFLNVYQNPSGTTGSVGLEFNPSYGHFWACAIVNHIIKGENCIQLFISLMLRWNEIKSHKIKMSMGSTAQVCVQCQSLIYGYLWRDRPGPFTAKIWCVCMCLFGEIIHFLPHKLNKSQTETNGFLPFLISPLVLTFQHILFFCDLSQTNIKNTRTTVTILWLSLFLVLTDQPLRGQILICKPISNFNNNS